MSNAGKTEALRIKGELDQVRNAIIDIIDGGQSVSIGDMTYTEVNINALREREKDLQKRLDRAQGRRPAITPVSFTDLMR